MVRFHAHNSYFKLLLDQLAIGLPSAVVLHLVEAGLALLDLLSLNHNASG